MDEKNWITTKIARIDFFSSSNRSRNEIFIENARKSNWNNECVWRKLYHQRPLQKRAEKKSRRNKKIKKSE